MCPHAVEQVIGDQHGLARLIRAYAIITHARASRGSSAIDSRGSDLADLFMSIYQRHSSTVALLASSVTRRAPKVDERGQTAPCIATKVSHRICYHPSAWGAAAIIDRWLVMACAGRASGASKGSKLGDQLELERRPQSKIRDGSREGTAITLATAVADF